MADIVSTTTASVNATHDVTDHGIVLPHSYNKDMFFHVTSILESFTVQDSVERYTIRCVGPVVTKSGKDHARNTDFRAFGDRRFRSQPEYVTPPDEIVPFLVGEDVLRASVHGPFDGEVSA